MLFRVRFKGRTIALPNTTARCTRTPFAGENAASVDVHYSGRKLTWLWHVSKAELRTTYLPQRYIFMTNAYQMAILTQFNENDTQTYGDISAGTRISDETLKPQVGLLVKARVLLQEGDTYDLNLSQWTSSTLSTLLIQWSIQISSQRRCAEDMTRMEAFTDNLFCRFESTSTARSESS